MKILGKIVVLMLILFVASLLGAPPAAAVIATSSDKDGDEHPVLRWDQQINTTSRFTVLSDFGGHAVRDSETGLVWEKSPSTGSFDWADAQHHCYTAAVGGRKGWRLPTVEQLASLVDPTQSLPALPSGNPFVNIQTGGYWSATTVAGNTAFAWDVDFSHGAVDDKNGGKAPGGGFFVWCVRGGQGYDGQ